MGQGRELVQRRVVGLLILCDPAPVVPSGPAIELRFECDRSIRGRSTGQGHGVVRHLARDHGCFDTRRIDDLDDLQLSGSHQGEANGLGRPDEFFSAN